MFSLIGADQDVMAEAWTFDAMPFDTCAVGIQRLWHEFVGTRVIASSHGALHDFVEFSGKLNGDQAHAAKSGSLRVARHDGR